MKKTSKIVIFIFSFIFLFLLSGCNKNSLPDIEETQKQEKYEVIFHYINGANENKTISQKYKKGDLLKKLDNTKIEREGYDFLGWYLSEDASDENQFIFNTEVYQKTELYARYALKKYKVTFKINDIEEDITVDYGKKATFSSVNTIRDGYTFLGWFLEGQEDEKILLEDYLVKKDVTLVARFTPKKVKVFFDFGEYDPGTGERILTIKEYDYGSLFYSLDIKHKGQSYKKGEKNNNEPSKIFSHWQLNVKGTEKLLPESTILLSEIKQLRPVFKDKDFKVKFLNNGEFLKEIDVTGSYYFSFSYLKLEPLENKYIKDYVVKQEGVDEIVREIGETYTISGNATINLRYSDEPYNDFFSCNLSEDKTYYILKNIKYPFKGELKLPATFKQKDGEELELPIKVISSINSKKLTGINLSNTVTEIADFAFISCHDLKYVRGIESLEKIGKATFKDCFSLKEFDFENTLLRKIDAYAFENCVTLKRIILPDTIATLYEGVFRGCSLVEHVVLKRISEIPNFLFENCKKIKRVSFPDTIIQVGEASFRGCDELVEVNLNNDLSVIKAYAFYATDKLVSFDIPKNVSIIGEYAFAKNESIQVLKLPKLKVLTRGIFDNFANLEELHIEQLVIDPRINRFFVNSPKFKKLYVNKVERCNLNFNFETDEMELYINEVCKVDDPVAFSNVRKIYFAKDVILTSFNDRRLDNLKVLHFPDSITNYSAANTSKLDELKIGRNFNRFNYVLSKRIVYDSENQNIIKKGHVTYCKHTDGSYLPIHLEGGCEEFKFENITYYISSMDYRIKELFEQKEKTKNIKKVIIENNQDLSDTLFHLRLLEKLEEIEIIGDANNNLKFENRILKNKLKDDELIFAFEGAEIDTYTIIGDHYKTHILQSPAVKKFVKKAGVSFYNIQVTSTEIIKGNRELVKYFDNDAEEFVISDATFPNLQSVGQYAFNSKHLKLKRLIIEKRVTLYNIENYNVEEIIIKVDGVNSIAGYSEDQKLYGNKSLKITFDPAVKNTAEGFYIPNRVTEINLGGLEDFSLGFKTDKISALDFSNVKTINSTFNNPYLQLLNMRNDVVIKKPLGKCKLSGTVYLNPLSVDNAFYGIDVDKIIAKRVVALGEQTIGELVLGDPDIYLQLRGNLEISNQTRLEITANQRIYYYQTGLVLTMPLLEEIHYYSSYELGIQKDQYNFPKLKKLVLYDNAKLQHQEYSMLLWLPNDFNLEIDSSCTTYKMENEMLKTPDNQVIRFFTSSDTLTLDNETTNVYGQLLADTTQIKKIKITGSSSLYSRFNYIEELELACGPEVENVSISNLNKLKKLIIGKDVSKKLLTRVFGNLSYAVANSDSNLGSLEIIADPENAELKIVDGILYTADGMNALWIISSFQGSEIRLIESCTFTYFVITERKHPNINAIYLSKNFSGFYNNYIFRGAGKMDVYIKRESNISTHTLSTLIAPNINIHII